MYYVYIVRCVDDSLYTGVAADLGRRLRQHRDKSPAAAKYTRSRTVQELVCVWQAQDRSSAQRLEYAIKHLPRAKKLALAAQPEDPARLLPQLSGEIYVSLAPLTLAEAMKGVEP